MTIPKLYGKLNKHQKSSERRTIIRNFLKKNYVGKLIEKEFIDNNIKNIFNITIDNRDARKLTYQNQEDVHLVLTQLNELIDASIFLSKENAEHKKFKTFYYFKVCVFIENVFYQYKLNVGKNKNNNEIELYAITNYNKNDANGILDFKHSSLTSSSDIIDQNRGKNKSS